MICPKCGMELKKISYRHKDFCDRVLAPRELAREYLDSGKTYAELASDYDASPTSLRLRVIHGLKLLGKSARPMGPRTRQPPPSPDLGCNLERCACGIILRTAVQQKRKACDFCAGITFDYMEFKRSETAVQRAIPVSVSLSI